MAPGVDPPFRSALIPGPRPDGERRLAAGAATLAPQRAFEIEKPGEGRPGAHQQFMGNGRPVSASPAGGLDQVPGAQVFETEIVARRLAHGSRRIVRSSFYMTPKPDRGQGGRFCVCPLTFGPRRLKPDPPSYGGEFTNVPAGQLRVAAVPCSVN